MKGVLKPSLNWLLVFVPLTVYFHFQPEKQHSLIFIFACAAIIPLAGILGTATEHLSDRAGSGIGGLLNATFGNAAELIIAIAALRQGLLDVVKASLTGSIIGNILLVLGASCLFGGFKYSEQNFNPVAACSQATMLTIASISLVIPAAFYYIGLSYIPAETLSENEGKLSLAISIVLLFVYVLGLIFSLKTHKDIFSPEEDGPDEVSHDVWSLKKAISYLLIATAFIAWMSEILVGSVEHAAHDFGMSSLFIGVVIVAIVGNAAEHSTAIIMALKNKMDLSLGIAIGSSLQIALFVAPLLVILSYWIAPHPMNLLFSSSEVLAVVVSVHIVSQAASDGKSNWFEGAQLLVVYVLMGLIFYFLPEQAGHTGIVKV
jgi:Ca2+:H+ antiporter